ncbi:hypothetical protein OS493_002510 [Desmophyllum pertusum]|uniref:Uncharacterized protein n=1 Tax=Desmophyllum pertusum TaxID=174260 RepID=A0A9W9YT32_9CNID|nr:hypothetical protein OS493_002510 [Desmophyllum pertusum]
MQGKLEKAVEEFKVYSERASSLFNETVACLEEMKAEAKLGEGAITAISSSVNMDDLKQALKKRPSVFFIVKIRHSVSENTVRVVDKAGEEVQPITTFTKKSKVPEDYVVVCDRDQSEQLNGIELIDSPGKNENDALDDVVDTFFEKETTPLVVYVIDGKEQLRTSDSATIRFLQDKYPQLSFMFLCNKVDTSTGEEKFDTRSSDELDSDDEAETPTKVDKQKTVFSQLQRHGFIADSESVDTCCSFYGISARNVREDRRNKTCSRATEIFGKFEDSLLNILEETVKRQAQQVVSKLIFLQMSLVHAMNRTEQSLPHIFGSPLEFDTAKSVEKSLFTTLTAAIASEDKIGMLVNCNLLSLEEKLMSEAVQFNATMQVSPLQELDALMNYWALVQKHHFTFTANKEDAPFLRFLIEIKGAILDRTFNDFSRVFKGFLNRTKDLLELHSRKIVNPQLRRVLEDVYAGSSLSKPDKDFLPGKTPIELLELLKIAVSKVSRKLLSEVLIEGQLHAMEWKSSNANFNLADKQCRRKIVELIIVKFSPQRITHSVSVVVTDCLEVVHEGFLKIIDSLSDKNDRISNNWSQQLEEMAALHIPAVRRLAVQGFALQFLLNNGPLTLGPVLKSTKHGTIRHCIGWAASTGDSVVKVIEEQNVEADVGVQPAVDLINAM